MFTVLMVCTGNTCRSPMAAAIFQDIAAGAGYSGKIKAISAGISAWPEPASKNACAAMAGRGLSLRDHRSKRLTEEQIIGSDLILTMTRLHKQAVLSLMPSASSKVFTLPEFAGEVETLDIADPFGSDRAKYEECAEEITGLLCKSWEKIVGLAGDTK